MPIEVSDVRSNPNDQIAFAARVIGRSAHRRKVFEAIYYGKKKVKTVRELEQITGLPRKRVLEEAVKLYNNRIVERVKIGKDLAYRKDQFYAQNKGKILSLAGNPVKLGRFPTKLNPILGPNRISISFPRDMVDIKQLTIDDIDSFSRVRENRELNGNSDVPVEEKEFKLGLQGILGEDGEFQDWGGESDDLFSTRLIINGERKTVAFGLKGKGTSGLLVPRKMGKRGDQIQRLFRAPGDVFIVQYWGQIDESVLEQLKNFAVAKSAEEGRRIYYGIIDGRDTKRLIASYPEFFPNVSQSTNQTSKGVLKYGEVKRV